MSKESPTATFWDHLDVLRACIIRSLAAIIVLAVVAFCLKEQLFDVVLAPRSGSFISYRLMGIEESFNLHLMNTGLTEQFMIHMRVALYAGLLLASPYVLYQLFCFVSPGLYRNERKAAVWVVVSSYVMFIIGTLTDYLLIFPLTVRFLGTYQVSPDVANMLTLQSYADTLIGMSFVSGVRTACGLCHLRKDGAYIRPTDAALPAPCRCNNLGGFGRDHPDYRCLHLAGRGTTHLAAI